MRRGIDRRAQRANTRASFDRARAALALLAFSSTTAAAPRATKSPASASNVAIAARDAGSTHSEADPNPSEADPNPSEAGAAHADANPASTDANAPADSEEATSVTVVVQGEARPLTSGHARRERRLLAAAPHRTGSDLLQTLPGMFLTQHGGEGKAHQIFYRGFDAIHGQDLEVLVGGVPINEVSNVHGQGYVDLHFVIPELVETLEVQPGPFSVQQGDFAVAGTARYRLGMPLPGVSAKLGLGSYGRRRAFVGFRPEGHAAADFVAVEAYDVEGAGERRSARRSSGWSQLTGWLNPRTSWRALVGYHAGTFESPGVLRLSDVDSGRVDRFSSYDADQGGHSARALAGGELVWHGDDHQTRLAPYLIERALDLSYNYTGRLRYPTTDHTTQRHEVTTVGVSAVHQRRQPLFTRHDGLELGASARHDGIAQAQVMGGEALVDADVDVEHLAAWAAAELHGIPRTLVHAGVRTDAFWFETRDRLAQAERKASGTVIGPKLAIDVALSRAWHVQLAAARGFRSPQARSLGDGESTPFTRVLATEVGTSLLLSSRVRASVQAYSSWLEDDLVFDERTARNEAAPSTQRSGITMALTTDTAHLVSSCSGSFMNSRFTASDQRFEHGQQVPYVPRGVARCDLELRHELGHWGRSIVTGGTGLAEQLVWQRPLPYGEVDPGYALTDLSLWLRWSRFELRLDVENLLDARWTDGEFVYASNFDAAPPSALPQRHVTVGSPRMAMLTFGMYGWH